MAPSSVSSFPVNPSPAELATQYAKLREAAISINRAKGQYRGMAIRRQQQIEQMETELASYAQDAKLDYQERAQLLSILSKYRDVFSAMETAGDDLVDGISLYDTGARPLYGGAPITRLIQACRAFVQAWKAAKRINDEIPQLEAGL